MGYQMNPGTAFISHTKSFREECRFSTFKILIEIFLGRSLLPKFMLQRGNNVWRHRTCRIPPRWLLKAARCSPDGWRDLWVFNGIFEHVIAGNNLNQFHLFHLYPFVICSDCGLWLFPCFHFESNYPSVHRKFWRYLMTCKKVTCSDLSFWSSGTQFLSELLALLHWCQLSKCRWIGVASGIDLELLGNSNSNLYSLASTRC